MQVLADCRKPVLGPIGPRGPLLPHPACPPLAIFEQRAPILAGGPGPRPPCPDCCLQHPFALHTCGAPLTSAGLCCRVSLRRTAPIFLDTVASHTHPHHSVNSYSNIFPNMFLFIALTQYHHLTQYKSLICSLIVHLPPLDGT